MFPVDTVKTRLHRLQPGVRLLPLLPPFIPASLPERHASWVPGAYRIVAVGSL